MPRSCSNLCPSSRWCHPTISSSVIPFSCLQSFLASGSFPMSQFFASGGQSIGVSASASVLPMNTQDWSLLGWTGWISSQSEGLSRVFSNTTVQKHQLFGAQLSSQSNPHIQIWPLEKPQPWPDGPLLARGLVEHKINRGQNVDWLEVECRRKRCQRSLALSLIKMGKMKKKQVWGYQESSFRHVKLERSVRHLTPTPVLLPGKSHGRRSLVGCSSWGR